MNEKIREEIRQSRMIHRPLLLDESEYAEKDLEKTPVLGALKIPVGRGLENWTVDPIAKIERLGEGAGEERASVRFTAPTRLPHWPHSYARIYHTPYATRWIGGEEGMDLQEYNRISLWVRPEMPGFKFVSLHLQIVNQGKEPVPDRYEREGCHHMNLKNHQWNHMYVEIPNVSRDRVTALKFGYDMVGNEREAEDTACFDISDIRFEKIERTAKFRGWEPEEGKILVCGSGYRLGSVKTAIVSHNSPENFKVAEAATGRVVLEKQSQLLQCPEGSFRILDFTEIDREGRYLIVCGDMVSRVFPVGNEIWESSVWKTLNLFFCERCGFEVPGIHKYCHGNVLNHHNGKSVVANGGWHDAADMSQCLANTSEAVYAMFLAASQNRSNTELYERLIEEGKWGLDWMLRTRFGDGYRDMESGGSVWTGNLIGDCDEMDSEAKDYAIENFMAAAAEALAAEVLREEDPWQSRYLRRVAREDWKFAYEKLGKEEYVKAMDPARVSSPVLLYSAGILAACRILRLEELEDRNYYQEKAWELAELLLSCQQQEKTDWDVPMSGFFFRDEKREQIQHYNHRSYEHYPVTALWELCQLFPQNSDWIRWYHGILLYTDYFYSAAKITGPYQMAPASIYHEEEAERDKELFLAQQAFAHEGMLKEYRQQVQAGAALGKGYYLKRFPVWFSYRGNSAMVLAGGNGAAIGARARNQVRLWELAEKQLQWIVGVNPFGQSLMLGEGYSWAQQYVCLPGPIAGSICVGIESFQNTEEPYWPQCSNAVYREMWVHPSIRYLLLAAQMGQNAFVTGIADHSGDKVSAEDLRTGTVYYGTCRKGDNGFELELPPGIYEIRCGEKRQILEAVGGREYDLGRKFIRLEAEAKQEGKRLNITVKNTGYGETAVTFLTDNAEGLEERTLQPGETFCTEGIIREPDRPWLVLAISDGELNRKAELYSS